MITSRNAQIMFLEEEIFVNAILEKCTDETHVSTVIDESGEINVLYKLPSGLCVYCSSKGNDYKKWRINTADASKRVHPQVDDNLSLYYIKMTASEEGFESDRKRSVACFQAYNTKNFQPSIGYGISKKVSRHEPYPSANCSVSRYDNCRDKYWESGTLITGDKNYGVESIRNWDGNVLFRVWITGIKKSQKLSAELKIEFVEEALKLQTLLDIERQAVGLNALLNESDNPIIFSKIGKIIKELERMRINEDDLAALEVAMAKIRNELRKDQSGVSK